SSPPARQTLTDLDDDGQALLHQVTDWYHRNLLNSPDALAWLEKRGLNHPELVSHFRLGFAGPHGVAGDAAHQQAVKAEELRFTRREVRTALGWGDTQLKIHLARLLEMEYLVLYRRGLTYEYALLWDGGSGEESHLCGLLDVDEAEAAVTDNEGGAFRSGSEAERSGAGRGVVGGQSGSRKAASGQAAEGLQGEAVGAEPDAVIRVKKKTPQLPSPSLSSLP
ncbi:hypothetical protein ABEG93_22685, partial [Pantoea agglomerans]